MPKIVFPSVALKRFFLPLMGIIGLLYFEEVRNLVYIPFISSPASFILFWNFPKILYFTNSKPLYYEDLFIDEKKLPNYDVSRAIKKRYRKMLLWSLIISNSIFIGGLSEYWFYKTHDTTNYLEIIGITGGIIKGFQVINNFIGRIILVLIRRQVKKENRRLRYKNRKRFRRMILLKRIQNNKWENITTPKDDINIIIQEKHHEETFPNRARSSTI